MVRDKDEQEVFDLLGRFVAAQERQATTTEQQLEQTKLITAATLETLAAQKAAMERID